MLLRTIPAEKLSEVCGTWKRGDSLQDLVGGQLFGVIESIELEPSEDSYLITSSTLVLEDCALMQWIAAKATDNITIGCFWSGDHQSGAIALHKGQFTEFSVSIDALIAVQKKLLLEKTDDAEIEALRDEGLSEAEIEETLNEWADEYRVEVRDRLQLEFLQSVHENNAQLEKYPLFNILAALGCEWELHDLSSHARVAKGLLVPFDYDDPESIAAIFQRKDGEFWKQHRGRIRQILSHLPDEYRDNKALFSQVIPHVAAWPLEYAGTSVRADKDIIRLAVHADKTHNYAASALEYVAPELLADSSFINEILQEQPSEFYNLPDHLKKDRDYLKIALKAGLFFPEDKSDDHELLETYISSGDQWVYQRIPDQFHQDEALARLFIENGGEWDNLPESLRGNQSLLECYLANYRFGDDTSVSNFELERVLADHLDQSDWESASLTVDFIDACLKQAPAFCSMLRYQHLPLNDWLWIVKNHNVVEYGTKVLKLQLALSLKKELNYTELFDQLNDLYFEETGDPSIDEKLRDTAVKMMELELAIAESKL